MEGLQPVTLGKTGEQVNKRECYCRQSIFTELRTRSQWMCVEAPACIKDRPGDHRIMDKAS